jgi:uncharacterized protein DUF2786
MAERIDSETDRVLARVRKMMALANDAAASEGERDNALRMAYATLAKHNLTMAEAEKAGRAPEEAREHGTSSSRDQPWCREVNHAVAELFFCKYWYDRKNVNRGQVRHNFVGLTGNVMTAREVADYCVRSIMSEANRRWKGQPNPGAYWTSFCKGAAASVRERCKALREGSDQPQSNGNALVLADHWKREMEKNALMVRDTLGLRLRVPKDRQKGVLTGGYGDGKAFGGGLSLSRSIGAARVPKDRMIG